MKHQRVILNPLRRFGQGDLTPHDGIPPTWDRDDLPKLPEGQEWFEIQSAPDYDAATQQVVQVLDSVAKTDGWNVVDLTPEEVEAAKPKPTPVTKLTIMNRLVDAGKWETFKSIMSNAPEVAQDAWILAQDIRVDDPIFVEYADVFKSGLDMTDEEFNSLLKPSN